LGEDILVSDKIILVQIQEVLAVGCWVSLSLAKVAVVLFRVILSIGEYWCRGSLWGLGFWFAKLGLHAVKEKRRILVSLLF
jgi:hypothetical protein